MEAWTWDPEDLSLTIRFLRALRGWTQTRLAQEAGLDKSRISLLESGTHTPDRELLQRLACRRRAPPPSAGSQPPDVEILPAGSGAPSLLTGRRGRDRRPREDRGRGDDRRRPRVHAPDGPGAVLAPDEERWSYQPGDRDGVEELYRNLEPGPQEERLFAIKEGTEFRRWALAERFCAESEKAAGSDATRALELAETAVEIARALSGPEGWRAHVEGYCLAFLSNAQKAAGRLDDAEQT